jgi:selenocysteine lyase/cysteine desulfurase
MVENYGDFHDKDWQPAASARRFESGTPNILGIQAFAASLSLINDIGIETIEDRVLHHTNLMHEYIAKSNNLEAIYSDSASKMSGIVTFRHNNCDLSALFLHLRKQNIMCAERGGGIRFSPHIYNTDEEIISALETANQFM